MIARSYCWILQTGVRNVVCRKIVQAQCGDRPTCFVLCGLYDTRRGVSKDERADVDA